MNKQSKLTLLALTCLMAGSQAQAGIFSNFWDSFRAFTTFGTRCTISPRNNESAENFQQRQNTSDSLYNRWQKGARRAWGDVFWGFGTGLFSSGILRSANEDLSQIRRSHHGSQIFRQAAKNPRILGCVGSGLLACRLLTSAFHNLDKSRKRWDDYRSFEGHDYPTSNENYNTNENNL